MSMWKYKAYEARVPPFSDGVCLKYKVRKIQGTRLFKSGGGPSFADDVGGMLPPINAGAGRVLGFTSGKHRGQQK